MDKLIKTLGIIAATLCGTGIIIGISGGIYNAAINESKQVKESRKEAGQAEWSEHVYLFTDPETKVQYIYFFSMGKAGVCPRYTADGKLYIERSKER